MDFCAKLLTLLFIFGQYSCSSNDLSEVDLDANVFVEKNPNYIPFDKSYYQKNKKNLRPDKKFLSKPSERKTGHSENERTSSSGQTTEILPEISLTIGRSKDNSDDLIEVKPFVDDIVFFPESNSTTAPTHRPSTEKVKAVTHSIYSEHFITFNRPPRHRQTTARPRTGSLYSNNFKTFNRRRPKLKSSPMADTKPATFEVDLKQGTFSCDNCGLNSEDSGKSPEWFFNRHL